MVPLADEGKKPPELPQWVSGKDEVPRRTPTERSADVSIRKHNVMNKQKQEHNPTAVANATTGKPGGAE